VRLSAAASIAVGELGEACVVGLELGFAGAVGVPVAALGLAVVAATPLDRDRDREDQGGDLADRPRDTAAGVLILERCGTQVRPIDPNQSATISPDCIMMAMPKNACIAITPMSSSSLPA
jgi:hypothetical protein